MAWNRNNEVAQKPVSKRSFPRGSVVGGLAIALAGLGVWLLLVDTAEKPSIHEKRSPRGIISEVKPHFPSNVVRKTVQEPVEEKAPEVDPSQIRVKTLSIVTNGFGKIIERYATADGKMHRVIRPARPPIFRHATDSIILMALAQKSQDAILPLPLRGDMDRQFLKSLREPIIIEKTDSEEIKERKRIVREARLEIKKLMDQGLHFSEILSEHEKMFNQDAEIRKKAIAEATKIRDEGDTEGTVQYVETMNAAFEAMGIEKIDMPHTKEERRAEIEAKRAARAAAKARKEAKP